MPSSAERGEEERKRGTGCWLFWDLCDSERWRDRNSMFKLSEVWAAVPLVHKDTGGIMS